VPAAGPAAEVDYTDHRYWVARARGGNTSGDWTTAARLEAQPRLAAGPISLSVTHVQRRIVTATNLAEWTNPGSMEAPVGSHTLPVGTPVRVSTITDAQPSHVQRYIFRQTLTPVLFPVKVTKTAGDPGDDETTCSYIYTVTTMGGTELGVEMTPVKRRPLVGAMSPPDDSEYGLAFFDEAGVFKLFDANEVIDTEAC